METEKNDPAGMDHGEKEVTELVEYLRRVRKAVLADGRSGRQGRARLPRYQVVEVGQPKLAAKAGEDRAAEEEQYK